MKIYQGIEIKTLKYAIVKSKKNFVNCQQILDITDNIRRNYEQF